MTPSSTALLPRLSRQSARSPQVVIAVGTMLTVLLMTLSFMAGRGWQSHPGAALAPAAHAKGDRDAEGTPESGLRAAGVTSRLEPGFKKESKKAHAGPQPGCKAELITNLADKDLDPETAQLLEVRMRSYEYVPQRYPGSEADARIVQKGLNASEAELRGENMGNAATSPKARTCQGPSIVNSDVSFMVHQQGCSKVTWGESSATGRQEKKLWAMVQPEQRKCETLEEDDPRRKFDADGDNVMCSTTVKLSWFSDRKCQEPANDIFGAHNLTNVLLNTAGRTCLKSITSTSNVATKSEAKSEIFVEYLATPLDKTDMDSNNKFIHATRQWTKETHSEAEMHDEAALNLAAKKQLPHHLAKDALQKAGIKPSAEAHTRAAEWNKKRRLRRRRLSKSNAKNTEPLAVTILSQAFGDPYFQHHAAAVAASRRFKDSSSTDRRKLIGGNGQSDDEVKGMMSMQKSGMTLEESQEKEQDVLANIEAEKGETFSGYTVKMDSDNKQWGSHTAVCASVGVAVNIIIYSFEAHFSVCTSADGLIMTVGGCAGVIFGFDIGVEVAFGVDVLRSIDCAPGTAVTISLGVDLGPVGAGVSVHFDKASGDFIGGGLSVDAGPSLGISIGGLEICHDYLVYANNAYIQWVKDMGTFKPALPEDCCKEIQPNGKKFYSGADSSAYCCYQSSCKACPEGYSTKMEKYGENRNIPKGPGYCFGDFIEKKSRWNNVCEWTGKISQASYAQDYLNGNDLGGSDKYRMIAAGMECSSTDTKLGHAATPDDCARLVKAHYGDTIYGADGEVLRATYFIHSMDGACYVEKTIKAKPCSDGGNAFEIDREYNFYMLLEDGRSADVATRDKPLLLARKSDCRGAYDKWVSYVGSAEECSRHCTDYFILGRTRYRRGYKCYCEFMSDNSNPCNANGDWLKYHSGYDFYTNNIAKLAAT